MIELTAQCTKCGWTNINNPSTNYSSGDYATDLHADEMYLGFQQPSFDAVRYKPFSALILHQFIRPTHESYGLLEGAYGKVYGIKAAWGETTVTRQNRPSSVALSSTGYAMTAEGSYTTASITDKTTISDIFTYGLSVEAESIYSSLAAAEAEFGTRYGPNPPYITLEFEDENSVGSVSGTPTYGYLDPTKEQTFRFNYTQPTDTLYLPTRTGAKIQYKTSSTGEVSEIICDSAYSHAVPANTFAAGTLIWRVVLSTTAGDAESDWYTLSTAEPRMTGSPVSPSGTVEDGTQPITFEWSYQSSVGSKPSQTHLQYSTNGTAWNELAMVEGPGTSYTAPAGTFTSGTVYWRAMVYNASGVAGTVSDAASFTVVAAPAVPSVTADGKPFTTVEWVSEDQQAYRVLVDGEDMGVMFGTETSYTLTDYLPDGEHTISVMVQGQYGLWSEPGEATFEVQNVPGDAVALFGEFGTDAVLTWATASTEQTFLVYRDGKRIGKVSGSTFTDRLALGPHEWLVVNILPGGYYTESNPVEGTPKSCETVIDTLLNPTGWLTLKLSANSDTSQRFSYSRTHSLRHFKGAALPLLEQSSFEDGSGTYDVSFATVKEASAFEAFKGKVVVIKSRGGNVVVGALNNLEKVAGDFFISYTFTVQRIYWEDFVDGQNS